MRRALLSLLVFGFGCSSDGSNDLQPLDTGTSADVSDSGDSGGTCPGDQQKCGDACVDTSKSNAHCGACGAACAGTCCGGKCVEGSDCTFAATGSDPTAGWQNGGEWVKLTGAGFAAGMKVFIGDGRASVRVLDPTSAIVQTPPGPFGPTTIKISLGTKSAVTKGLFRYASAGLTTPWQQKPMSSVRGEWPGVAVMQDGRVLIAGGTTQPDHPEKALKTAEIYTRSTDKVVNSLGSMATPRWRSAAITLLTGKVLVVGGACWQDMTACNGDPSLGDVYDPTTDVFSPTAKLNKPRVNPRLILLPDGKVFVTSTNDPSIEIYDPDKNAFTLVANDKLHYDGFAVRLFDGRVLMGAGSGGITNAELFDPDTGVFTATTGPMTEARWWPNAHTMPDGRVFVIGGYQGTTSAWTPIATMEAYDPKTGTFVKLPYALSIGRASPSTALVRDGTLLVMGGYTKSNSCDSMTDTVDQVDPVKGAVTEFAKLPNKNTEWNAVTLLDGSVLSVGGGECGSLTAQPDLDFLPGIPGPK